MEESASSKEINNLHPSHLSDHTTPGPLPIELWIYVARFFTKVPDLYNLVLCNSLFYHSLMHTLQCLRYRKIKVNDEDAEVNAWYPLLLGILHSTIPVEFVEELDCGGRYHFADSLLPVVDEEQSSLIYATVVKSPWILEDEVQGWMNEIRSGNEDAVASLVIPLLPNLRTIHLARGTWWKRSPSCRLLTVVTRIANASVSARAERRVSAQQPSLPLSKLTLVAGVNDGSRTIGVELEDLPPFAALPSVKRIIVTQTQDNYFRDWPQGLPRSLVPEIYFMESSIPREVIEDFVNQGIGGPCVIRSQWCPRLRRSPVLSWDHIVVDGMPDEMGYITEGTREVKCELKYDNPSLSWSDEGPLARPSYKRHSGCSDAWGDMMEGKIWDI